jgi:hypothetical protein
MEIKKIIPIISIKISSNMYITDFFGILFVIAYFFYLILLYLLRENDEIYINWAFPFQNTQHM